MIAITLVPTVWHNLLIITGMPSSVVRAIRYDSSTHTLRVVYVSGMVYDYKKVPERVYEAMKKAASKGTYLNYYIKGKYEFERVEG